MKAQIAFLPGDGVGPEVLGEARRVLATIGRKFNHTFDIVEGDIGGIAGGERDDQIDRLFGVALSVYGNGQ